MCMGSLIPSPATRTSEWKPRPLYSWIVALGGRPPTLDTSNSWGVARTASRRRREIFETTPERFTAANEPAGNGSGPAPNRKPQDIAERVYAMRAPLKQYFSRKVADPSEVEDLVQDVFVRILRRGALDHTDNLVGYVFLTASTVLKDRNRRNRSRQTSRHTSFQEEFHSGSVPGPEAGVVARESLRISSLILMELPERPRTVFLLRRLENLSFAEIARRLGISISAVEKHMLKATRHLAARTLEGSW